MTIKKRAKHPSTHTSADACDQHISIGRLGYFKNQHSDSHPVHVDTNKYQFLHDQLYNLHVCGACVSVCGVCACMCVSIAQCVSERGIDHFDKVKMTKKNGS